MSPRQHFFRWAVSAVAASLFATGPIVAAEGGPSPSNQGSPPPQIDSYQPFPAAWDQPITIHGSHLVPWQDPSTSKHTQAAVSGSVLSKPVELLQQNELIEIGPSESSGPGAPASEGSEPVLKVGGEGKKAHFVIPASDIESWTPNEIRIKKLSGGMKGAYWIGVYQNGKLLSNRNRTLFFSENDPNATHTLVEDGPSDDEEEDEEVLLKVDYPPVQEPSQPQTYILSYTPNIVGAGDEVTISGAIYPQGNRRLFVGAGNKPLGRIKQQWIKEWSFNTIRFENGFLPTGVYWVAIFEGLEPVSNLLWTLQVTEDPPPSPPLSGNGPGQLTTTLEKVPIVSPGGSNVEPGSKSGLQRMHGAPGAVVPQKPLQLQRPMQPPSRVKSIQPNDGAIRSPSQAPTNKVLKTRDLQQQRRPAAKPTTAPSVAPVPEKTDEDTTPLEPTRQPSRIQLQQVR